MSIYLGCSVMNIYKYCLINEPYHHDSDLMSIYLGCSVTKFCTCEILFNLLTTSLWFWTIYISLWIIGTGGTTGSGRTGHSAGGPLHVVDPDICLGWAKLIPSISLYFFIGGGPRTKVYSQTGWGRRISPHPGSATDYWLAPGKSPCTLEPPSRFKFVLVTLCFELYLA